MMARIPVRSDSSRKVANAVELALTDLIGDPLQERSLVDLVGQLGDDDLVAAAARRLLDEGLGADHDASAPGGIRGLDPLPTKDRSSGREVRAGDDLHQVLDRGIGIVNQQRDGVAKLVQIMRRNVRGHADGDAGTAVEQQVRQPRRQYPGLLARGIVVGNELDGVLVNIGEELVRDRGQTRFGVSHRRRTIAVDRTEVSLAIDERVAEVEVLRHADEGVVDGGVAVGVIVLEHLAHDTGALAVACIRAKSHLRHGKQDAAMDRFQAISSVGQCALHDDTHGVIEIGLAHLGVDACQPHVAYFHEPIPLAWQITDVAAKQT